MQAQVSDPGRRVRLSGRVGLTTAAEVRSVLHREVEGGSGDLVVDVTDVEMLDATALGVLVGTHRRACQHGRRLVLAGVPPRIERLLLATRLYRVLYVDRSPLPAA